MQKKHQLRQCTPQSDMNISRVSNGCWGGGGGPGTQKSRNLRTKNSPNQYFLLQISFFPATKSGSEGGGGLAPPLRPPATPGDAELSRKPWGGGMSKPECSLCTRRRVSSFQRPLCAPDHLVLPGAGGRCHCKCGPRNGGPKWRAVTWLHSRNPSESTIRAVLCYDCPIRRCGSGHNTRIDDLGLGYCLTAGGCQSAPSQSPPGASSYPPHSVGLHSPTPGLPLGGGGVQPPPPPPPTPSERC